MHKNLYVLIIPLVFTFTFDYYFSHDDSSFFLEKETYKITILKDGFNNVHKNLYSKLNSSTINKFYSEEIIKDYKDQNIVTIKPKKKIEFTQNKETFNLTNKDKANKSLTLNYSDWKNDFSDKKIKFILTVLPLIKFENNKIILERKRLLDIRNYLIVKKTLKNNDIEYLNKISKKYKILLKNKHKIDIIDELLINVNLIPNSIVLAQAANESGWGTSRFAKEYNALFGQYTYDENSGVIPSQREEGKKHFIKNFKSIEKSVESYFRNINSHYAYKKFRELRSQINDFENDFNIKILTSALEVYAEDKLYVNTINKIIDSNNLNQFDLNPKGFFRS